MGGGHQQGNIYIYKSHCLYDVCLSQDASKAATGAADFSAKVWDALSGEEELTLQHKHIVKSVNFSADSAALATGSNDKILR